MNQRISKFANWFNDHIAGHPVTLVICILFVVVIFSLLAILGFNNWNLSVGLVGNDIESAYELISGTAAVVAVVAIHKTVRRHHKESQEQDKILQAEVKAHIDAHVAELHRRISFINRPKGGNDA